MKKISILLVVTMAFVFALEASAPIAAFAAPESGAAAILSSVAPGTGEWYNGGYKSPFPWGEFVLGLICPCVRISSVLDAASGDSTGAVRIQFWSVPAPKPE